MSGSAPRWPALDGVRALAVLTVVGYHAFPTLVPGGLLGVDVFFVLSGFLITALLLQERTDTGRISLRRFYLRRLLRLYPALLVVCTGVVAVGLVGGVVDQVLPGALAALLYAGNWWLYTGHDAGLLDHTWTLAIEEHFYVLWPVLLVLTARFFRGRAVAWVSVIALAAAGIVLVAVLGRGWPESIDAVRGSYLRGVPIFWGVALAVLLCCRPSARAGRPSWPSRGWAWLTTLAALSLVGLACWPALAGGWPLSGPRGAAGLLSVLLVASAVRGSAIGDRRILASEPAQWIGQRAYGIYLVHFPVVSLLWHQAPQQLDLRLRMAAAVLLTLVLAGAMYRWVERPFLQIKDRLR